MLNSNKRYTDYEKCIKAYTIFYLTTYVTASVMADITK